MQITEDTKSYDQMNVMDKYERIIAYLYPIAQSIPRKHGTVREMFLKCLLSIPDSITIAGKSNQVSKVYVVDANLGHLRFWLRFLVLIKCMTPHQHQVSQVMIAEVGKIVNSWIKNKRSQGQNG
jgi:hypothetical protein